MSQGQSLYIIDAHAHIFQAFHAILELTSPDGRMVNAVYGFAATLLKILRERRPTYLVVAFDLPGPTFRHERYPAYKANREAAPDDLPPQVDVVRRLLDVLGVPVAAAEGFEADDVIGTLAAGAVDGDDAPDDLRVVIVTTDKDAEQLISDRVCVYNARKDEVRDESWLREHRGVGPGQVVDLLGLAGDSSDNVPGVPGIGPKTAAALIGQFGSLEAVLEHVDDVSGKKRQQNLRDHADSARLSRDLVTIRTDAPVDLDLESARTDRLDRAAAAGLFRELGFHTLVERLDLPKADAAADRTALDRADYVLCNTESDLAALMKRLTKAGRFAFDLETTSVEPVNADIVGYAVATAPGKAWYVPVRGPAGATLLDPDETLTAFRPLLADAGLEKVGQNLKYDAVVLRQVGVRLAGIAFDTMVASYLLDPGRRRHNLDELALEYLDHTTIPTDALIGKGRDQITMDMVDVRTVCDYACEDADVAWRLAEIMAPRLEEADLRDLYRDVEIPLIDCLVEMESNGVAIDVGVLERMAASLKRRLADLEKSIHNEAGEAFNVGSPKQLAHILFEKIGLRPIKKTKTGFSTDQEVLEELAVVHRLPALVVEHRQLSKLLGTYVEALPRMISPRTGRIHTSFNQTVTATGRLSSSDPNLQNIPVRTAEGRAIREAFVPSCDGALLLTADYSQVELRVLAHVSRDDTLVQSFLNDEDIHAAVAARIAGVGLDDVTPDMRRRAKAVNFGIVYGQSPYGLSRGIGIPVHEAEQFIDAYFDQYPGVERFIHETLSQAAADGHVTTILGRRRPVSGIREAHTIRERGRNRSAGERIAVNTVIQGSAADLMKVAMNRIIERIRSEDRPARMVMQIHDELIFEVPEPALAEEREMVVSAMSGACSLSVPLKVDTAAGPNWMEVT